MLMTTVIHEYECIRHYELFTKSNAGKLRCCGLASLPQHANIDDKYSNLYMIFSNGNAQFS
jgi:hypothetical protein